MAELGTSRAARHELGALETARARLLGKLGTRLSWLARERFPLPRAERLIWPEIQRTGLVIPCSDSPEVSVVIPVYGQLAMTWSCLKTLAEVPAGRRFELIVADDRSPDRTLEMLSHVRGVRVLENSTNLGFLRSVNRAASEARGEWLCLLNNDTRVTPGWLDELLRTFESFPRAGLVGAKLLFANGRLQEAGGSATRDGTTRHYGRRSDPARPEYCYARPVDYCSAACVLIRKAVWDELGGFDEHYAPAYYEDTDLGFRLREHGYDSVYQPACRIVHYEGVTHGKSAKNPRHQAVLNRARFHERWKHVLARHEPLEALSWKAADRRHGPGMLLLTRSLDPSVLDPNGLSIAEAALAAAAAGFRVAIWRARRTARERETEKELGRRGIELWAPPYAGALRDFLCSRELLRFDRVVLWDVRDAGPACELLQTSAPHAEVFTRHMREGELSAAQAWQRVFEPTLARP